MYNTRAKITAATLRLLLAALPFSPFEGYLHHLGYFCAHNAINRAYNAINRARPSNLLRTAPHPQNKYVIHSRKYVAIL